MPGTLGTLPGWLTLLTLMVVGYLLVRGGTGTAVSGLQDTNRELVRQIGALKDENTELRGRVRALEAKTDVSEALVPVVKALQDHEQRAAERHDGTLHILELVAERIGPEHESEA